MSEWIHQPLFSLLLTLVCYHAGDWVYQRTNHNPVTHPLLMASIPLVWALNSLSISAAEYKEATLFLHFLLGPAVVALAIPLYRYGQSIRSQFKAILLCVLGGGSFAAFSAIMLTMLVNQETWLLNTVAVKSVTSPIAMSIAELTGAHVAMAVAIVLVTGVVAAVAAPPVFKAMNITDERQQGIILGIVGHGVGTARAFDISAKAGAYASLGMCLTGSMTAILLPLLSFLFFK